MKQRLTPLVTSLFLLGIVTAPAYAAKTPSNAQLQMRTQVLEKQVSELQQEINTLNNQKKTTSKTSTTYTTKKPADNTPLPPVQQPTAAQLEQHAYPEQQSVEGAYNLPQAGVDYFPFDVDVPGQSFVSTGPYIGVPLQYSGNDLIINSPSVNEDVTLLKLRKNINQRLRALGRGSEQDNAHLLLSGTIEGQVLYQNGAGSTSSDVNLTNAALDAYVLGPTDFVSGLLELSYDNDIGSNVGSLSTNYRVANSRVFVNKAFIILGNFEKTGFYSTLGQMYVPFGTYSSNMVSSPLTKILGRTKARALLLGYQQQTPCAFYTSAYVFRGDTHIGSNSNINNGGVNAGYRFKCGDSFSGDFGGGVIGNIADSGGMQLTGGINAGVFNGFGGPAPFGSETIVHRVPAYNLRGLFSWGGHIDLLAEYIGASTSFNPNDLSFNNSGAKPWAVNGEAAYSFSAFDRPSSVAVGYGAAKEALALGLPAQRYSFVFNTSWWRNTLQSLEFRHDINYPQSDFATGSDVSPVVNGVGRNDNVITAQFDIYF